MSSDDILAGAGLLIFLVGLYLWLGLAAALMILGIVLIFIAWRLELPALGSKHEPDQADHPNQP